MIRVLELIVLYGPLCFIVFKTFEDYSLIRGNISRVEREVEHLKGRLDDISKEAIKCRKYVDSLENLFGE
jgi:hypothetical protein